MMDACKGLVDVLVADKITERLLAAQPTIDAFDRLLDDLQKQRERTVKAKTDFVARFHPSLWVNLARCCGCFAFDGKKPPGIFASGAFV